MTRGRFKVLTRTDGKSIVYDPALPIGQRTAGNRTFDKAQLATEFATTLADECPADE